MGKFIGVLCSVTLSLASAAPAVAAKFVITYKGVVSQSADPAGIFGTPGGNVDGMAFQAIYTLDDTQGTLRVDPGSSIREGGSSFTPPTSSPVSAVLKIGEWTLSFGRTGYYSVADVLNDYLGAADRVGHEVADVESVAGVTNQAVLFTRIISQTNNIVDNTDLTAALSYTAQADDFVEGGFGFYTSRGGSSLLSEGVLRPTSVTIAPFADNVVPEPEAWALLIVGFGLAGVAARRRRRETASRLCGVTQGAPHRRSASHVQA